MKIVEQYNHNYRPIAGGTEDLLQMDPKDVVEPLFSGLLYGPDRKPQVFNNYKKPPMTPTGNFFFPHSLLLIGLPTL